MKSFVLFRFKSCFYKLLSFIVLLFIGINANAQCYDDFYVYQVYPYGALCSPQTVTLRAEYYNYYSTYGEFRWYTSETAATPVGTCYINQSTTYCDYNVYATNGSEIWVSYYDYTTGCESFRQPYFFYIASPAYAYQDYATKCNNDNAKVQVRSNASGVTFQLYKLHEYWDPLYGQVQEYQFQQSNTTGYFEISDFNPNTDQYNYYVKLYQPYGCSTPYYYQLDFELTGPNPPTVTGNLSIVQGTSTTLIASGNAYTFHWYDEVGNKINDGWQYITPTSLNPNTYNYTVKGVSSDETCLTNPASITLTVSYPTVAYTAPFDNSNFTKTIDLAKPVGIVEGSADVNGAATYTIPIFASPGTNGVQPTVSVNYNSQASAGVAGYGWNIAGLSMISRSGKNMYQNGSVQPVKYNTGDAFVLDGMWLSPISGSNGAEGTIYAGESETFANIVSKTSGSPNNPDWFKVTAKDGTIMEYGRTADSRVKTNDGLNVMFWRLNRTIDINGNYIDYVYDNSDRDSRIKTIKYTGNDNAGLHPSAFINFKYAIRTDQNTVYEAGGSMSSKFLLNEITVIADNDKTVKSYLFNYGFDNVNSLLKEVIEKGTDGTAINSTIFLYGEKPQNIVSSRSGVLTGPLSFIPGDFNADGKSDLLSATYTVSSDGIKYHTNYDVLSNISVNSATVLYSVPSLLNSTIQSGNKNLYKFLANDYNGDGRDDILLSNSSIENVSSTEKPLKLNGISINHTSSSGYSPTAFPCPGSYQYSKKGNFFIPGDFNGDGNQDYILILSTYPVNLYPNPYGYSYKAFLTSPSLGITNSEVLDFGSPVAGIRYSETYAGSVADADNVIPLDFDGDGKNEILVVNNQQASILNISAAAPSSGYLFQNSILLTVTTITKDSKLFPGDFNGDRKTDLLVKNSDGTWTIMYSTGKSFTSVPFSFNQTVNLTGVYSDDKIVIGDFNGDGRSDILHGYSYFVNGVATTSKLSLYYSRGNGIASSSFYYEQYDYPHLLTFGDLVTGDFNGDGRTDILNQVSVNSDVYFISIKPLGKETLLSKVTNGYNATTAIEYTNLTDKSTSPYVYNRTVSLDDPVNENPFNYVQLPIYVASKISVPNGIGGTNITTFAYEDAVIHRSGKGFLGFKKITSKNSTTGITSITENDINTSFAVPYTVKQKTLLTSTSQLLSESQITNSFVDLSTGSSKRFLQRVDKILSIDYLNGTASENTNTYDSYGNVTTNVVKTGTLSGTSVSPIETTTTTTTYGIHNTPVAAKPDEVTVTNLRSGTPISNTTKFYYTTNGLVSSQVEFEGLPKSVTTSFAYNGVGNLTQTTKSSTGMNNRISNMTYDPRGIFVVSRQISGTGVLQTESFSNDYLFGNTLSHTSSDCLTTTFEYDAFGRLKKTTLPEGYSVNNSLNFDVQGETVFNSFTDYPGGSPDVKKWFDKLGREIKKETGGFNSKKLTQLTTYDAKGNVATSTNSYYPSETPITTTNTYDAYNRLTTVTNPLTTITTTYTPQSGGKMQVETHDATGQSSTKIYDATGKTITAIDKGGQLDYTYDSRGNQTQVKHGSNILITNTYDNYGRPLTVADKDAGTVSYEYDAYGQLRQQSDNNGNVYVMQYDDFGRITSRQGPEGTTLYEYYKDDVTGCSNNNLAKVTGFNQTIKEYTFDQLKRPATEKITIEGVPYTTQYSYDGYSNLNKITYPSGVVVNNTYGTNGELLSVTGGSSTSPTTLFTGTDMDGFGNYTDYTLGNSKVSQNTYTYGMPVRFYTQGIQDLKQTFDYATGNLLSRQDAIKSITENFEYDALNRLTKSTVNSVVQLNMAYDGSGTFSMGNITSKTDAGSYVYKSDKLHAVAYITNPAGAQTPPANISTVEQNISYTPYLKTASITEGAYQMDYTYGPDYERVKSILKQNSTIIETKYYLGDYEKQISGGVTREIHYVSGGNGLCAMIVRQGGVNTFYFVYTDQLGSILTVTDINGTKVAEQNFDAWGRNRNPANWQYASVPVNPVWLYRGYTGHEHVPQFALINMNGRMYDPIEGRMLSPDNYVSDPFNTQGYNRYTYAMNNPLSYTDPDGNMPVFLIPIIIGASLGAFAGGIQADMQGKSFWSGAWKGAIVGGISGLAGFYAPAGILPGIAYGGTTGGIIGGFSSVLNGDNFWKGFIPGMVLGGAIGGISGGMSANKIHANLWTGKIKPQAFTLDELNSLGIDMSGDPVEYSSKALCDFSDNQFGKSASNTTDYSLKVPKGYKLNADGSWAGDGETSVLGYTTNKIWAGGNSYAKVYISKKAFESKQQLFLTLGHELTHAQHIVDGLMAKYTINSFKDHSERAAYEWSRAAAIRNKFSSFVTSYDKLLSGKYGYPAPSVFNSRVTTLFKILKK